MDFAIKRAPIRYRLLRLGRWVANFISDLPYRFRYVPLCYLRAWLS